MQLHVTYYINEHKVQTSFPTPCIFSVLATAQRHIAAYHNLGNETFIQEQDNFAKQIAHLLHTGKLDMFSLELQLRLRIELQWVHLPDAF